LWFAAMNKQDKDIGFYDWAGRAGQAFIRLWHDLIPLFSGRTTTYKVYGRIMKKSAGWDSSGSSTERKNR